eukprot:3463850-Pyramimonas_sp.AAC.1
MERRIPNERRLPRVTGLRDQKGVAVCPSPPVGQEVSHVIEAFNAHAGKQTLKKRLECTSALVLMAQEIGYHEWGREALSS